MRKMQCLTPCAGQGRLIGAGEVETDRKLHDAIQMGQRTRKPIMPAWLGLLPASSDLHTIQATIELAELTNAYRMEQSYCTSIQHMGTCRAN